MLDQLTSRKIFYTAFERVRENAGCRGADGIPLSRFERLIDAQKDSVRIYRFCRDCGTKVEIHGWGTITQDPDVYVI